MHNSYYLYLNQLPVIDFESFELFSNTNHFMTNRHFLQIKLNGKLFCIFTQRLYVIDSNEDIF